MKDTHLMKRWIAITSLTFFFTSVLASTPTPEVTTLDHARFNTEVAENLLRSIKKDVGGHRAKALDALVTVTNEINAAILYAKEHPGE